MAQRRKVRNRFQRTGNISDAIQAKKLTARLKRIIRRSRKKSWEYFCSSLNDRTADKFVWARIKNIGAQSLPRQPWFPLVLEHGGPLAAAEAFLQYHFPIGQQQSNTDDFPNPSFPKLLFPAETLALNKPFSMTELDHAIRKSKRKCSPGPDNIPNSAFTIMSETARKSLLATFNNLWNSDTFPEQWTTSHAVPILKSGKSPNSISSYRIIALSSCVLKLMERMVVGRLTCFLEKNKVLPEVMTGFRRHRSTSWNLLDFVSSADTALKSSQHTIAVFLDLEAAFDSASHSAILFRLQSLGIQGHMFSFISNFLTNRFVRIKLGRVLSQPATVTRGVPQGAVLSPLLFNLLLADLPVQLPHTINCSIYADDLAIWASGKKIHQIESHVQEAILQIESFCRIWQLKISPSKSVILPISKSPTLRNSLSIQLAERPLSIVSSHKFLGVIIDSKLSWKEHFSYLESCSTKRLHMLRCLSHQNWGANTNKMLLFYKAFILTKLLYGCPAFAFTTKTLNNDLEKIQSAALRICLGVPKQTPCSSIRAESTMPPLHQRRLSELDILLVKMSHFAPDHQIHARLLDQQNSTDVAKRFRSFFTEYPFSYQPAPLPVEYWTWNLPTIISVLPMLPPKTSFDSSVIRSLALEEIKKLGFPETEVYTDGSFCETRKTGGASFTIPSRRITRSYHLSLCTSSTYAELVAIHEALLFLTQFVNLPTVIFSDSKSALESLKTNPSFWEASPLIRNILATANYCYFIGSSITLCWIPAHCGVSGNEAADKAAKDALNFKVAPPPTFLPPPLCNILHMFKETHVTIWKSVLIEEDKEHHRASIDDRPSQPFRIAINRGRETRLTRARLGTAYTASFLAKCQKLSSPNCRSCANEETKETITHLLLECPALSSEREEMLRELIKLGLPTPLGLSDILSLHHPATIQKRVLKVVDSFLRATGRHL